MLVGQIVGGASVPKLCQKGSTSSHQKKKKKKNGPMSLKARLQGQRMTQTGAAGGASERGTGSQST